MPRSGKNIEQRLAHAIEDMTPDVLPEVLLRLGNRKGDDSLTNTSVYEIPAARGTEKAGTGRGRRRLITTIAALAAALALTISLYQARMYYTPQSFISFDVNPSIALGLNRSDRVLSVEALNADGETVIGDMDLKGVGIDVAVNALVGSMVKNGYISETTNSILISVDSSDPDKGAELQKRLSEEVDSMLSAMSVSASVLSQTVTEDERISALAGEYGISLGKAALVDLLVSQDDTLDFAGVAALSINDINLLIASRQTRLDSVETTGTASSAGYIGKEAALSAALGHAGIATDSITKLEMELDYDDGRMIYEIEFYVGSVEYEYDIDAHTGDVLKFGSKEKGVNKGSETPAQPSGDVSGDIAGEANDTGTGSASYIGSEAAKAAALAHAGVSADSVKKMEVDLDHDDGRMIYEVEFKTNDMEYEYEIDAYNGEILHWKSEKN